MDRAESKESFVAKQGGVPQTSNGVPGSPGQGIAEDSSKADVAGRGGPIWPLWWGATLTPGGLLAILPD
jgi:hypothetical protein